MVVLGLTATAVVSTGMLGALVLRAIRRRSLLLSIVVAALMPVAAVSAAAALNVNRMVISQPTRPSFRSPWDSPPCLLSSCRTSSGAASPTVHGS